MTEQSGSDGQPRAWTVIDSKYLIKRWWMNLRRDRVQLGTGVTIDEFHVLEYPDWTCIVCRTPTDSLVMVNQYRHGISRVILELPAGGVSAGEEPLVAAKRELLEETGYAAENWRVLGSYATEPSRHTNLAHFFFADDARRVSSPEPDASEDIRTIEVPIAEVRRMVGNGKLVHGVQLSALLLAEREGLLD